VLIVVFQLSASTEILKPSTADIIRPSTDRIAEKKTAKVGDLNLDSLLDEIRSIGRKI